MNKFQHIYARDLNHVSELLRTYGGKAVVVSGGSDLLPMMKDRLVTAEVLINLRRVPGIDSVQFDEARGLRIGAMTTLRKLETDPMIAGRFAALAQAATTVASPQIRNVATIGGNLSQRTRCWYYRGPFHCWLKGGTECFAVNGENKYHAIFGEGPCFMVHASDIATALYALNGQVSIAGPHGRRTIPVDHFFVNPSAHWRRENTLKADEIVTEIFVPTPPKDSRSGFVKVMERAAWDAAIISIAYSLVQKGGVCRAASIALGGVATTPMRARKAEHELVGKTISGEVVAQAVETTLRAAHPMSQNAYKLPLLQGYLQTILS